MPSAITSKDGEVGQGDQATQQDPGDKSFVVDSSDKS